MSISPAISVGSFVFRSLEYQTHITYDVRTLVPATPPPTETYSIDKEGHKHNNVTISLIILYSTDSITTVHHIYLFGQLADWLEVLDTIDTINDVYGRTVTLSVLLVLALYSRLEKLMGFVPPRPA
jgi:hypothetical protein